MSLFGSFQTPGTGTATSGFGAPQKPTQPTASTATPSPGALQPTTLFGTPGASGTGGSLFGSSNSTSTGSSLFGASAPATTGSATGGSLFGGGTSSGGGLFGAASSTSQPATSSSTTGSGLFGSSGTTGTGMFGSTGQASASTAAASSSGGLFGSSGTVAATGGATSTSASLFGATGSSTGSTPSTSLFGSSSSFGGGTSSSFQLSTLGAATTPSTSLALTGTTAVQTMFDPLLQTAIPGADSLLTNPQATFSSLPKEQQEWILAVEKTVRCNDKLMHEIESQLQPDVGKMLSESKDRMRVVKAQLAALLDNRETQSARFSKLQQDVMDEYKNLDTAKALVEKARLGTPAAYFADRTGPLASYYCELEKRFNEEAVLYHRQLEEVSEVLSHESAADVGQALQASVQEVYSAFLGISSRVATLHERVDLLREEHLKRLRELHRKEVDPFREADEKEKASVAAAAQKEALRLELGLQSNGLPGLQAGGALTAAGQAQPQSQLGVGATGASSSLFGGTPAVPGGSLFGATTPAGGGLFGSSAASTQSSLFGSSQPSTSTGLFGAGGATQPQTSGGSLFGAAGAQPSGGSLFGAGQPSSGGGLFGASAQTASSTSGSLFGSATTGAASTGGSLFGGGAASTTTPGGAFGTPATQTSLFGGGAKTETKSSSPSSSSSSRRRSGGARRR